MFETLIGFIVIFGGAILVIAILIGIFAKTRAGFFFIVRTQERAIVERLGKFKKVAEPGLNMKMPMIDKVTKPISLRIQQLEVNIESKTKDNVFVTVPVAVQYVIGEDQVRDAYYSLSNPEAQIRSYVFDTVRSALSRLNLDAAFESKDDIARTVEETLSARMNEFGYRIINTLVTDISPDPRVRDSMNSINAAQRDREAAQSLAEADKIKRVTQAQAEAESRRLQGEGVAAQRKAIAVGIAEQYEMLRQVGIEDTAEQLLLMNQYFDTLQEVARNGNSNVLLMPSNPAAVSGLGDEIRNAMFQAQAADDTIQAGTRASAARSASRTAPRRPSQAAPQQAPAEAAPQQQPQQQTAQGQQATSKMDAAFEALEGTKAAEFLRQRRGGSDAQNNA